MSIFVRFVTTGYYMYFKKVCPGPFTGRRRRRPENPLSLSLDQISSADWTWSVNIFSQSVHGIDKLLSTCIYGCPTHSRCMFIFIKQKWKQLFTLSHLGCNLAIFHLIFHKRVKCLEMQIVFVWQPGTFEMRTSLLQQNEMRNEMKFT